MMGNGISIGGIRFKVHWTWFMALLFFPAQMAMAFAEKKIFDINNFYLVYMACVLVFLAL